jgi:hypothetical protein
MYRTMIAFESAALITDRALYRAAFVSKEAGEREVRRLTAAGVIAPLKTPTGRTLFTCDDGRRVFESLQRRSDESRVA